MQLTEFVELYMILFTDKIIGRVTMELQERGIHFSVIYTALRPSRVSNLQCLELSDFYHPIAQYLQKNPLDDFQDYTDKQSILYEVLTRNDCMNFHI